jgi:hypothetical protein
VGPASEKNPRKQVALELLGALGLTAHDVSAGRGTANLAS